MADTGWKYASNVVSHVNWQGNVFTTALLQTQDDSGPMSNAGPGSPAYGYINNFSLGVPAGAIINGIEIATRIWQTSIGTNTVFAAYMSWDNGTTWCSPKAVVYNDGTAWKYFYMGGPTDTWGRSWSASDFSNANFQSLMQSYNYSGGGSFWSSYDVFWVKVYYTESLSEIAELGDTAWPTAISEVGDTAKANIAEIGDKKAV